LEKGVAPLYLERVVKEHLGGANPEEGRSNHPKRANVMQSQLPG
jgi:hypothetical protein